MKMKKSLIKLFAIILITFLATFLIGAHVILCLRYVNAQKEIDKMIELLEESKKAHNLTNTIKMYN